MGLQRSNEPDGGTALLEAVETLSQISELDFDQSYGIVEDHSLSFHNRRFRYQTICWFHKKNGENTLKQVRTIFRAVLHYLCRFYSHRHSIQTKYSERLEEGIRSVMVLVGEAAQKLDRFNQIFKHSHSHSVTNLKEYRQLQNYYRESLVPQVDERLLSHWILSLSQNLTLPQTTFTSETEDIKHLYVDLEAVTKDTEYELFYLRREDGSRFFNPRLLRNMKVVSDLERSLISEQQEDPLLDLPIWKEGMWETRARHLLRILWPHLAAFYKHASPFKDHELAGSLNKAMMALLLAGRGADFEETKKQAVDYFRDFLFYVSQALSSEEYQNYNQSPFHRRNLIGMPLVSFLNRICYELHCGQELPESLRAWEEELVSQALVSPTTVEKQYFSPNAPLAARLQIEWAALNKLLKHHPNGALHSVLQDLQQGRAQAFAPWKLSNLPYKLWGLQIGNQICQLIHLPAPVVQETMNKGAVAPEFLAYLKTLEENRDEIKTHLLINLQDRTSWREYLRCQLIENYVDENPECENLKVITLATDTDFYHQMPPYDQDNHAELFLSHFMQHLQDEHTGFYFPPSFKVELTEEWLKKMFHCIHSLFFEGRNVLTREKRLDFIQIAYLFLILKALDYHRPASWSLSCKDCIDTGAAFAAQIFFTLKLWKEREISEEDFLKERALLFLPALILRERSLQSDRFIRFMGALKSCEAHLNGGGEHFVQQLEKELKSLYSKELIDYHVGWFKQKNEKI